MKVPFMNLSDGLEPIKEEILAKIGDLIDHTRFVGGEDITLFEEEFASFCGTKYSVGCANGTDALILALKILNIGPGDTVVVPANTFIATSEAVTFVGANVEFVDVCEDSWTMDPVKLEEFLNQTDKDVKAVIPVHIYGRMADMPAIMAVAEKYKLKVVEDSAQAHGALLDGKGPGHWGDMATFSFYPGKNLGAFGDAGALVTNNTELAERAKAYANHGRLPGQKYEHGFEGANLRIDTLQAAILRIKLRHLAVATDKRIALTERYTEKLSAVSELKLPASLKKDKQVFHLYVIHHKDRENLKKNLAEAGISTGIHYPIPLHQQPAYAYKNYAVGSFPVAEYNAAHCLTLPLWPEMTKEQQDYVIAKVSELCRG
ncbi:MAG: hypothetical protein B6241_01095 [Spirochaetaceae bacterium 4572_59]|nr:MAG: hypothetical protein B6241_01095 [Spirochaetaceae bacterium 4572_59]